MPISSDPLDQPLTSAEAFFPRPEYINNAQRYILNKLTSHRVVALGEHHMGGNRNQVFPRCIRSFVADLLADGYRFRDEGSRLVQFARRPRALALEITEDELPAFSPSALPRTILYRSLQFTAGFSRIVGTTVAFPVLNQRALWLAMSIRPDDTYREMLMKIAVSVPDSDLIVRGIDAKHDDSFELGVAPLRMVDNPRPPAPAFAAGLDAAGTRDCFIADRLARLASDMFDLDLDARRFGTILVLLGDYHIQKRDSQVTPRPRFDGAVGGRYPLGHFLTHDTPMNRRLALAFPLVMPALESYWAVRCVFEGASALPGSEYLLDIETRRGFDDIDVSIGAARAYDLLSSLFLSYNGGVDLAGFEAVMRDYGDPLTPMSVDSQRPLADIHDAYLFFRRMSSWHPLTDPYALYERTQASLESYIVDGSARTEWERGWSAHESAWRPSDPLRTPGLFGGVNERWMLPTLASAPVRRSQVIVGGIRLSDVGLPVSEAERQRENQRLWEYQRAYGQFFYRRVSFVVPYEVRVGWWVMLIGYGFLARPGEVGRLEVKLVRGTQNTLVDVAVLEPEHITVLSDTVALVLLPSFDRRSRDEEESLGFQVVFPSEDRNRTVRILLYAIAVER